VTTNRTRITRRPAARITPEALRLFQRIYDLHAAGKPYGEVEHALHRALGGMPWQPSVLEVDHEKQPPPDVWTDAGWLADWRAAQALRRALIAEMDR
jgi:hypothetical protein